MKKIQSWLVNFLTKSKNWLKKLPLLVKIIIIILLLGAAGGGYFLLSHQTPEISYQTATATKGTLITSISGSGTITSGNSTNITSKISGVVSEVYVTNGQTVNKGDKIALIDLDEYATERQTSAWANYLDAQEAVKTAQKNKASADLAMWEAQDAIIKAEDEIEYKNINKINPETRQEYTQGEKAIIDKKLDQARAAFAEAELKYKNADSEIAQAKTEVTSALRDYQENSATIIAPAAGVVNNLNLATGMVVSSTSSSNTNVTDSHSINAVASQTFGKVMDENGSMQATVSLTEIDIINVQANQKVTLTLDAYEDQTFTGKVLAVDTDGATSSGVTSYEVTILLDQTSVDIYPNMAVSADIITDLKTEVIMIPTTAITTFNEQSVVQILKDGQVTDVTVEIGIANDSQTEIISGISEGDEVITDIITTAKKATTDDETSAFSGTNSSSSNKSSSSGMGGMTGGMGGMSGPPGM